MATIIRERRVVTGFNGLTLVHRILNTIVTIINVLLVIRLILKAFGANSSAPFVNFIYRVTAPLVYPFTGIFPNPADNINSGVFEWASLIAIVVYSLVVLIIERIVDSIYPPAATGL